MHTTVETKTRHAESSAWQKWWSPKGSHMGVRNLDEAERLLVLGPATNLSASLTIQEVELSTSLKQRWLLSWRLLHTWRGDEGPSDEARGQVLFTESDLRAAFCFADEAPHSRAYMAERFEAHLYVIGRFIRHGPYLNVPGPGTGTSIETAISVFVHPEISEAVERLLAL